MRVMAFFSALILAGYFYPLDVVVKTPDVTVHISRSGG
jgi:hypothetical protein